MSPVQAQPIKSVSAAPIPTTPAPSPAIPSLARAVESPVPAPPPVIGPGPASDEKAAPTSAKVKKQAKQSKTKDSSQTAIGSEQSDVATAQPEKVKDKEEPMIVDVPAEQSKPLIQQSESKADPVAAAVSAPPVVKQPEPMVVDAAPQPAEAAAPSKKVAPKVAPKPTKGKKGASAPQSDEALMQEPVQPVKTESAPVASVVEPTPVVTEVSSPQSNPVIVATPAPVVASQPPVVEQLPSGAAAATSTASEQAAPVDGTEKASAKSKKSKGKNKK